MRALLIAGLLAAASLLAACQTEEEAAVHDPTPTVTSEPGPGLSLPPTSFDTVDQGDQSGIVLEEPQLYVLRDQGEWEEFWARHTANVLPATEPPPVDFASEMVVAVVDRQAPSGGFSIEVVELSEGSEGTLDVLALRQAPGAGCIVTQVLTQPFHIVKTGQSPLEPSLVVQEETYSC